MPPRGLFGVPHGVLSSTDEKVAFLIGVVALAAAVLHDGELDMRPVSSASAVGVAVALAGSFAAPAAVSNEWHIPVLVVLLVAGSLLYARQRS
ncbi:MAG: hypothetical protein ABEJ88_10315 [Halobacterium sp.]